MTRKKAELGLLLSLTALFCFQTYLLLNLFIPAALAPYSEARAVHAHIETVVGTFMNLTVLWFLLAILGPVARLIGAYVAERKARLGLPG
jgi:hypothetical protein